MAEEEKNKKTEQNRVNPDQRFRYIGFEVFPGKPKDLFKSDQEKNKYIESVRARRERGEIIRDDCTLMEERVSVGDRAIMFLACLLVIGSLFIPWYSAYNQIEEEVPVAAVEEKPLAMVDSMGDSTMVDSTALIGMAMSDSTMADTAAEQMAAAEPAKEAARGNLTHTTDEGDEIIVGLQVRKKVVKEYARLSGIGSLAALGSIGSMVFSSGIALVLTAVIVLIYTLLCVLLPLYSMYGLFGIKGDPDTKALKLKSIVRFNWIPLGLFVLILALSFVGANYGFADPGLYFDSIGTSYSPAVLLETLSWGMFVSLCGFILIAVKGAEI